MESNPTMFFVICAIILFVIFLIGRIGLYPSISVGGVLMVLAYVFSNKVLKDKGESSKA